MSIAEDLQQIARQERELQFRHFDHETAWELGSWLRESGVAQNSPIVIDVRRFEQQLFFTALPGSKPDNTNWVRRKSNTVARFLRSSYAMGLELKAADTNVTDEYALLEADYAVHGGSFPIAVLGAHVIGSVTVSGLPQREDHNTVVRALCALLGKNYGELALADLQNV